MTIVLEIQHLSTGDLGRIPLEKWQPENPEDVWLTMSMEISKRGEEASDIFSFTIATPAGIRRNLEAAGKYHQFGRFYLIVQYFDWQQIRHIIEKKVKNCERDTWEESVQYLSKNFGWEYEDCGWLDLDWLGE